MTERRLFRFHTTYFIWASVLFLTEAGIALFVSDRFIRPYFGDYLVVILIYCTVRACADVERTRLAVATLLFAYGIEILQYFSIVDRLGLADNIIAKTVIGYGFSWWDMLAYTLGIVSLMAVEYFRNNRRNRQVS